MDELAIRCKVRVPMAKPNRSTDSVLYLYCSAEEKQRIALATQIIQKSLPPGAVVVTYRWALEQVLAAADRVVEEAAQRDAS